jgi:hypothetical protein
MASRRRIPWTMLLATVLASMPLAWVLARGWSPGHLEDRRLVEASGLSASTVRDGLLWAVNDSGNEPDLFALTPEGRSLGRVRVEGVRNVDWEAMASGPCPAPSEPGPGCLYIGDIGDNKRERATVRIIIVREPATRDRTARPLQVITVRYEDRPHNAEGLVLLNDGTLMLVPKLQRENITDLAGLYHVGADGVARVSGSLSNRASDGQVAGPFTDAVAAPDGNLFVRDYRRIYQAGPPSGSGVRPLDPVDSEPVEQGETLAFTPGGLTYTTEGRGGVIFTTPLPSAQPPGRLPE